MTSSWRAAFRAWRFQEVWRASMFLDLKVRHFHLIHTWLNISTSPGQFLFGFESITCVFVVLSTRYIFHTVCISGLVWKLLISDQQPTHKTIIVFTLFPFFYFCPRIFLKHNYVYIQWMFCRFQVGARSLELTEYVCFWGFLVFRVLVEINSFIELAPEISWK